MDPARRVDIPATLTQPAVARLHPTQTANRIWLGRTEFDDTRLSAEERATSNELPGA